MGFWREKVAKSFRAFNVWFQDYKERHPWFKTTWQILTHPTTTRVLILALAIGLAPFTGGTSVGIIGGAHIAAISLLVIKISMLFATTLISVAAKAIQLRRLEKVKLKKGFTGVIAKKREELMSLKKGREKLFNTLKVGALAEQAHSINTNPPGKMTSLIRTLRDVGGENVLAVTAMSVLTGVGGGILLLSLGSGMLFITGEFKERLGMEREKSRIKKEINKDCREGNIRPYKDLKELHEIFTERMIEYEAVQRMTAIFDQNTSMAEKDIKEIYGLVRNEVETRIGFKNIPPTPNFWKSAWHGIRPWGERYATPEYNIPMEDLVKYKKPDFSISKKTASQRTSSPTLTPVRIKQRHDPRARGA
jgi:hypothetical protein